MEVKWYGINALEFRCANGTDFAVDLYVSRDREKLNIPAEVDKYIQSRPQWMLMTHAHWDHLADMPQVIAKTDTVLYASRTACNIMRTMGVKEGNLREIHYGDTLEMPGGVTVQALESRHMGQTDEAPGYAAPPPRESLTLADNWRCGEVFAFLIQADGLRVLNVGSANFLESAQPIECDVCLCGISRWKEGFPQLLQRSVKCRYLIPTHHDEFRKPLSEFHLRDDLDRLQAVLPDLSAKELAPLAWTRL
ncbi:MAG: hypothetical protein IJJ33_13530 [Victivallales bacterium]|nr:hypothetical protein [Victivallales bacterium]